MTEAKHTPGPWTAVGNVVVHAQGVGPRYLADCNSVDVPRPQQAANARLIAAAPDLLEACKQSLSSAQYMVRTLNGSKIGKDQQRVLAWRTEARILKKLIAKAEGGESC